MSDKFSHFDETKDYKKLHLEWIKANPRFRPKRGLLTIYNTYLEEMESMYRETIKQNKTAYIYLYDDYQWSKRSKTVNQEVSELFGEKPANNNPAYFVTFNWSDENFDKNKILDGLRKLFTKSWIDNASGVFEYHGLQNNHPHFHCIIQTNKYKTFGKFKDKIFQSSIANTLSSKNFIDIKPAQDYHVEYIELDKTPEKQQCISQDIAWRSSNSLLEKYNRENFMN